jgi:putative peptide zinc metalloprotease protein
MTDVPNTAAAAGQPALRPSAPTPAQAGRETAASAPAGAEADTTASAPIQVPERPERAPEIELGGQMKESAFENEPWLLVREGRFMQVPHLLYAVVEASDGQHTLEQIAESVTETLKRAVTADNIRQIAGNLIVAGVLRGADGSVVKPKVSPGLNPLSMNMRMAMLPPGLIEPVTAVLRLLFWPPLVLAVVAAAVAAEIWIYAVHGVGGSIHQALYGPGVMLILLGIIVVAAGLHEFGHASALRYGGGKVGGMGAGLYLIYPAFYTDVTDNYRLPRWSRVRTDLGGLYFNLIAALAVMGLYILSGWEFLLLVVVVINIEMIHQLLPFVRLDGYWFLADLSGIPDFFSQIGPFLRSILPSWVPMKKGPVLPPLKTWARVFFMAYILITIPLLLFILFLMLRTVPRLLATVIDALQQHLGTIGASASSGDWVTAGAALAQVVLLALPTIGTAWILFAVGKRALLGVWHWSEGSVPKRVVAAAGTIGAAALIVLLWAPQVILPGTVSPFAEGQVLAGAVQFEPIRADERFTVTEIATGATAPPAPEPSPVGGSGPGASAAPSPTAAPPAPDATPTPGAATAPPPEATAPPATPSPTPMPSSPTPS